MKDVAITTVKTWCELAHAIQIRTLVFVVGQHVSYHDEVDQYEDDCVHFIAWADGMPAGTVRYRMKSKDTAKLERMAVLKAFRGYGLGKKLVRHVIEAAKKQPGCDFLLLGAQDQAIPFYEGLGFAVVGEGYMDAGIAHHDMVMQLY